MRLLPASLVTVTLGLTACSVNPATGDRQLILMSRGQEVALGREYDQQIVATMGLYDDASLQQYVQDLGMRLAAASENPELPWTFRVVDDPVVNAFALPGGFIYVTRGILAHMDNEAQLAAVLGHEIGHVTARHSAAQAATRQLARIGLVAGVVLRPELERYAGVASAGLNLLFLSHSRDDERQADDLGFRYMQRGGYDAREMAEVFTMLSNVTASAGGRGSPEWLASHPNPENRRERIEQAIAEAPADPIAVTVERDGYLRRIDGVTFGDDPAAGYFRATSFRHPGLRFAFDFPSGWATVNRPDAVIGISAAEDAIVQLSFASGASAAAAAAEFLGQDGVHATAPTSATLDGLTAVGGAFEAEGSPTVVGEVLFVEYQGQVMRLIGYAAAGTWNAYAGVVGGSLRSLRRLTDPADLDVEPRRIEIVMLPGGLNFREFAARYGRDDEADLLLLINQTHANARFARGQTLKRVTAGRLP